MGSGVSVVGWDQVGNWLHNLEEYGYRTRVVLAREDANRVRVSVTISLKGPSGRYAEVMRAGEVVGSRDPSQACKAAIRACAQLLSDHARLERMARQPLDGISQEALGLDL